MEDVKEYLLAKSEDGVDVEIYVISPTHKIIQDASLIYNMKVASLIRGGKNVNERLLLRAEVEEYLEKFNIWTNEDRLRMEQLGLRIRSIELLMKKGGIKLSEGRQLTIETGRLREQMLQLYNKRQQLDSATIESVAENHRFNFLISQCVFKKSTEQPYYGSFTDYLNRSFEQVAITGAKKLAEMLYGLSDNIKDTLFENKWLKKAGFVNDDGKYIDKQGRLTDIDGRRINENGRFIDEEGNLVDKHGNSVDQSGDFLVVESQPFIDDETGNAVVFKEGD
jgi:hypothetical protein